MQSARSGSPGLASCRNVLIYFAPLVVEAVVQRLTAMVSEGGFLFLGHAEALHATCSDIEMEAAQNTVFYRKRGGAQPKESAASLSFLLAGVGGALDPGLERPAPSPDWQLPASESAADPGKQQDTPIQTSSWQQDLEFLLRQEKWSEAEQTLRSAASEDLRNQVLLAELCFVNGRIDEAQQRCEQLLAVHFLDAEPHQLMAMCMEQKQRLPLALEHARRASYLDPNFALPHVLLGRLALKAGNRAAAMREFETARGRLPAEQSRRLRLLSGGFGRQAMIEYCEAQIRVCRGSA